VLKITMNNSVVSVLKSKANLVQMAYPMRLAAGLLGFYVSYMLLGVSFDSTSLAVISLTLVYPHVAVFWASSNEDESKNLLADSFIYAFLITIWGFHPLLTVIYFVGALSNDNAGMGIKWLLRILPFAAGGIMAGGLVHGFYFRQELPLSVALPASLAFVGFMFATSTLWMSVRVSLNRARGEIQQQSLARDRLRVLAQHINEELDHSSIRDHFTTYVASEFPGVKVFFGELSETSESDGFAYELLNGSFKLSDQDREKMLRNQEALSGLWERRCLMLSTDDASWLAPRDDADGLAVIPYFVKDRLWGHVFIVGNMEVADSIANSDNALEGGLVLFAMGLRNANLFALERQAKDEAERQSARVTSFYKAMNHELRTPLTAVIGYSELLLEEGADRSWDEKSEYLNAIYRSGDYLLSLIENVFDQSAITNMQNQDHEQKPLSSAVRFDLKAFLYDMEMTVQTISKGLSESITFENVDLPEVAFTDPVRLRQIVLNLVNNAMKYAGDTLITVRTERESESLLVSVCDQGPGLSADQVQRIFKPYTRFSNDKSGMGLGLAISLRSAKMLDGQLSVTSELGKGCCFQLRVPAFASKTADLNTLLVDNDASVNLSKALIVDRDQEVAAVLGSRLNELNVRWLAPKNVDDAVVMLRSFDPDVVFLDPGDDSAESGALMELIRAEKPGVVVVAFTAQRNDAPGLAARGFMGYLKKPFKRSEVEIALRKVQRSFEPNAVADQGCVFVVEDHPATARLLKKQLTTIFPESTIYTYADISSATEASQEIFPDIAFVDWNLGGSTGLDFVTYLRQTNKDAKIFVVSGETDRSSHERSIESGANGHINKPLNMAKLRSAIEELESNE